MTKSFIGHTNKPGYPRACCLLTSSFQVITQDRLPLPDPRFFLLWRSICHSYHELLGIKK